MKISLFCLCFFLLVFHGADGQAVKQSSWKPYVDRAIPQLGLSPIDSIKHEKVYRIWLNRQVIELVQVDKSTYHGCIVSFSVGYQRNGDSEKVLTENLLIPGDVVKSLMTRFLDENIEILPDCDYVLGYQKGLDGSTVVFEVSSNHSKRLYSYWGPEGAFQNNEIKEVRNVRAILNTMKSELNLNKVYTDFHSGIPPGFFIHLGGSIDVLP